MKKQISVIFDMDGVLLDTERLVIRGWKQVGPRFGVTDMEELERVARACIGSNEASTKEIFENHYRNRIPGFDYDEYRNQTDSYIRGMMKEPPVKKGAMEILKELKRLGIPLAIASSTREASVRKELGAVGLLDFFDRIVGGDMIKRSKPAPDIYLAAAKALGADPKDCLVIEDSYHGVRAASAAGMKVFMVPDLLAPIPEITALCEGIYPDLTELWIGFQALLEGTEDREKTTLLYTTDADRVLMLHRIKKGEDINKGKWIGIGGHLEPGEPPDECLVRESKEEAGFTPENPVMRAIVTFRQELGAEDEPEVFTEIMYLYTSGGLSAEDPLPECNEGVLEWVEREKIGSLELWEGDRVFLQLLADEAPFFKLDLTYGVSGVLKKVILDDRELELFDVLNDEGEPSGVVRERSVVHRIGSYHHTVHMWISRVREGEVELLLQKRSRNKDSNPGCFDISSAGHMSAGDEAFSAARRELKEELGLELPSEAIRRIGKREKTVRKVFYGKPFIDHELSEVYLITEPVDENTLTLQSEEVESVCWKPLRECIARLTDPEFPNCIDPEELYMIRDYYERGE